MRYVDKTPAEILTTMGATMRVLLHRVAAHGFTPWDSQHPSTRDALLTRGLVEKVSMGRPATDWLIETARGRDVADLLDGVTCQLCTRPVAPVEEPALFGGDAA